MEKESGVPVVPAKAYKGPSGTGVEGVLEDFKRETSDFMNRSALIKTLGLKADASDAEITKASREKNPEVGFKKSE